MWYCAELNNPLGPPVRPGSADYPDFGRRMEALPNYRNHSERGGHKTTTAERNADGASRQR